MTEKGFAAGSCHCNHVGEGVCCFRKADGMCKALGNCDFNDGLCHFRKKYYDGPNLYDQWCKERK